MQNAMLARLTNIQGEDTASIAALKVAKEATNNNEEKARYTLIFRTTLRANAI